MRGALLALSLALSTPALAQAHGSIAGVVVDASTQKAVDDAQITARSPALAGEQSAVTDSSGAFEMTFLPPGAYSISVKRDGYQPFTAEAITIRDRKLHVRVAIVAEQRAALAEALEFNDAMTPPAMISGPVPQYTPEALERGVEGNMQVRCIVSAEGAVRGCRIVKGLPFMNIAVVDALQKRKYTPALLQGKPVDVWFTFNLRLKLPGP